MCKYMNMYMHIISICIYIYIHNILWILSFPFLQIILSIYLSISIYRTHAHTQAHTHTPSTCRLPPRDDKAIAKWTDKEVVSMMDKGEVMTAYFANNSMKNLTLFCSKGILYASDAGEGIDAAVLAVPLNTLTDVFIGKQTKVDLSSLSSPSLPCFTFVFNLPFFFLFFFSFSIYVTVCIFLRPLPSLPHSDQPKHLYALYFLPPTCTGLRN